jgi:hypothetical protein
LFAILPIGGSQVVGLRPRFELLAILFDSRQSYGRQTPIQTGRNKNRMPFHILMWQSPPSEDHVGHISGVSILLAMSSDGGMASMGSQAGRLRKLEAYATVPTHAVGPSCRSKTP